MINKEAIVSLRAYSEDLRLIDLTASIGHKIGKDTVIIDHRNVPTTKQ